MTMLTLVSVILDYNLLFHTEIKLALFYLLMSYTVIGIYYIYRRTAHDLIRGHRDRMVVGFTTT